MSQMSRAFAPLPEDLVQVPSTHVGWLTVPMIPAARDPTLFLTSSAHSHTDTHTHINNRKTEN